MSGELELKALDRAIRALGDELYRHFLNRVARRPGQVVSATDELMADMSGRWHAALYKAAEAGAHWQREKQKRVRAQRLAAERKALEPSPPPDPDWVDQDADTQPFYRT